MDKEKIKLSDYKKTIKGGLEKTKTAAIGAKDAIVEKLDVDGDGQVGIEDIIILAFKTPGVYIERSDFLKKQLFKN